MHFYFSLLILTFFSTVNDYVVLPTVTWFIHKIYSNCAREN